ncbi:MAG: IPTL-CTERM sorting domain-containing protein [Phycisphaerae bacterium]|nr:IPTL-CTERM sorting domain-containing protein [Phycisphaerae bacterium]
MKLNRNTFLGRVLLCCLAGMLCGLFPMQALGEERLRLAPGEQNWEPPKDAEARQPGYMRIWDLNNPGVNANLMVEYVLGRRLTNLPPGVAVGGIAYAGAGVAGGVFTNGWNAIRTPRGMILSSGRVDWAKGGPAWWNNTDSVARNNGQPGDPMLNPLAAPWGTFDRARLQFTITNNSGVNHFLWLRFVFASDESNEWIFRYNDVCGIFVNGVNIARARPNLNFKTWPWWWWGWWHWGRNVSVDNVNGGSPFCNWRNARNPGLYINNDCSDGWGGHPCNPARQMEADGVTLRRGWWPWPWPVWPRPLRTTPYPVVLQPGQAYNIVLAVADTRDPVWDSWLFVRGALASDEAGACCYCDGDECHCEDGVTLYDCTTNGGDWTMDETCITLDPPCGNTEGVCYLPEGNCLEISDAACAYEGGYFNTETLICSDQMGACCTDDGVCHLATEDFCLLAEGTYGGDGSECSLPGACTLPDGACIEETTASCCAGAGGTYLGEGEPCPPIIDGACCLSGGSCSELPESECEATGGTFQGAGSVCLGDNNGDGIDDACDPHEPIPTISEWGLIGLALLLCVAGAAVFARRRKATAA